MIYEIVYTKRALQALPKLKAAKLGGKVEALVALLERDPFQNPPPYESLLGTLKGSYSRRINHKHRLVYQVYEEKKTVKIISMWSHYEF